MIAQLELADRIEPLQLDVRLVEPQGHAGQLHRPFPVLLIDGHQHQRLIRTQIARVGVHCLPERFAGAGLVAHSLLRLA